MTTVAEVATPFRFRGQNAHYVDIGARGTDRLALSVEYAVHPSNTGCFILRFVAHGPNLSPAHFKHLTFRQGAQFLTLAQNPEIPQVFKGLRLNKLAIKAFSPAILPWEVDEFATNHNVWTLLEEWIAEQVKAEGFDVIVNLAEEIRSLALERLPAPPKPSTGVTCVIEFPDLAAPAAQAAALKLVEQPEDDEDETEIEEDEDDDPKEWLN